MTLTNEDKHILKNINGDYLWDDFGEYVFGFDFKLSVWSDDYRLLTKEQYTQLYNHIENIYNFASKFVKSIYNKNNYWITREEDIPTKEEYYDKHIPITEFKIPKLRREHNWFDFIKNIYNFFDEYIKDDTNCSNYLDNYLGKFDFSTLSNPKIYKKHTEIVDKIVKLHIARTSSKLIKLKDTIVKEICMTNKDIQKNSYISFSIYPLYDLNADLTSNKNCITKDCTTKVHKLIFGTNKEEYTPLSISSVKLCLEMYDIMIHTYEFLEENYPMEKFLNFRITQNQPWDFVVFDDYEHPNEKIYLNMIETREEIKSYLDGNQGD